MLTKYISRKEFLETLLGIAGVFTLPAPELRAVSFRSLSEKYSLQDDLSLPSPVKTVILVNMDGGMSHVDTLDPKPNCQFPTVATSLRGVHVSEVFRRTAQHFNKLTVVRTTFSEDGDHAMGQHLLNTGYRTTEAAGIADLPHIGAMVSYVKSQKLKDRSYFPRYVTMGSRHGKIGDSGFLSVAHSGFHIGDPTKPLSNISPSYGKLTSNRIQKREEFLEWMNLEYQKQNSSQNLDMWNEMYTAAREFRDSDKLKAFDLSQENEKSHTRYGKTWQSQSFLLARRLTEIEVPFIQISIGGWDTHDNNKARIQKIMLDTDQGLAALIEDLHRMDLWKQTLFVLTSEFGRTPDVGTRDGRDHYPRVWTSLVGGGKISQGNLFGETDAKGEKPREGSNAVHLRNLIATVQKYAGINPKKKVMNGQNRPIGIAHPSASALDLG